MGKYRDLARARDRAAVRGAPAYDRRRIEVVGVLNLDPTLDGRSAPLEFADDVADHIGEPVISLQTIPGGFSSGDIVTLPSILHRPIIQLGYFAK